MSRSLITGSSGFLGSHLALAIEARGDEVHELDRALFAAPDTLKETIENFNPDHIYNLQAYGNHIEQNDIDMTLAANVINTYMLLRQSRDVPYKAFVNVSTSSVNLPVQTFYSATKAAGEKLAMAFKSVYGKPVVNVRPASVYGPGESDKRFIPQVIHALKNNTQIPLVKNATHSWVYVEDVATALIKIASRAEDITESVNISCGEMYTNWEVVRELEKISGKTLRYEPAPSLREYDSKDWLVGNYELKKLGFTPKYDLVDGLKHTFESY